MGHKQRKGNEHVLVIRHPSWIASLFRIRMVTMSTQPGSFRRLFRNFVANFVGNRSLRFGVWSFFFLLLSLQVNLLAAPLSDPSVDKYNTRVGTQTFAALYKFTTNTVLVETAQAIQDMGSDTIKMYLGPNFAKQYRYSLPGSISDLYTLARNETNVHKVFDMPFRHIIAWAYPFSNPDAPFQNGTYTATEANNDYNEMYNLTRYLRTNYNNSGKSFYLGHWEGDGYLNVVVNNVDWATNPSPAVVSAMIAWESNRQKAVDDARTATASVCSNISVFYYAECNRVHDALYNGTNNNVRVINDVIPYVTNLDFVSYSSYDAMNRDSTTLYTMLNYIETNIPPVPAFKSSLLPSERLWIGEYGWGGSQTPDQQEPTTRSYMQRLLNFGQKSLPYILFWEMYDNETNADGTCKAFYLIDTNNTKVATYYLHQRFINTARLKTAQFKETNGRLPTDSEFVGFMSPLLNQPFPAPVNLSVGNAAATTVGANVQVAGTLSQGVYGDDQARVSVFWGTHDGGTARANWDQNRFIAVNTNFNPTTFIALLTNIVAETNYYYRFYASNATGEVWAPVSTSFGFNLLDPSDFGSRLKLTFSGYTRAETLTNFQALINLSTALPGFSYHGFASPTGGDLRFTDSTGTNEIPFEIDEWNTNGTSRVWVRVPRLSSPSDSVWAYWGNPFNTNPPPTSSDGSVWSPNHIVVFHLKESGFPYVDSVQQHTASSGVAPTVTTGQIGQACSFNGTSQFLDAGVVDLGDAFTLSAWVNVSLSAPAQIQTIWANQRGGYSSNGFALFINTFNSNDHKIDIGTGDGTNGNESTTASNAVSFGSWHLVELAMNRTNGTATFFVDGAGIASTAAIVKNFANNADLNLGRFTNASFYYKGAIDEARIALGVRSTNASWATWMTSASNPGFTTYSSITQQTPQLSMNPGADGVFLFSWPATGVGFTLETATNLAGQIQWTPVTNQPAFQSSQWQLSVAPDSANSRFYRLHSS